MMLSLTCGGAFSSLSRVSSRGFQPSGPRHCLSGSDKYAHVSLIMNPSACQAESKDSATPRAPAADLERCFQRHCAGLLALGATTS